MATAGSKLLQATKLLSTLAVGFLVQEGCGEPVELTVENFDSLALHGGKNALVKFHAPWCGHCKNVKPTWDKLGEAYKASKTVLIGDVDCTSEQGEPLCKKLSVGKFPTFMYWTRDTGEEGLPWNGERDYEIWNEFVTNQLVHFTWCNANSKENCSDEQVTYIAEQQGKTKDELSSELTRLSDIRDYGTPYKAHPEYHECAVIDPGPACNPKQTRDLEPKQAFECCNYQGPECKGFLYVSSSAQKARDGDEKASVYFCKGDFFANKAEAGNAIAYLKPPPEDLLPDSKPEARTWLLQRIEMLESLLSLEKPGYKKAPEKPVDDVIQMGGDQKDEL